MTEASGDALAVINRADRRYVDGAWSDALALYEQVAGLDPPLSELRAVPLAMAHCRLELAADPAALVPPPHAPAQPVREEYIAKFLRARALELCRAGETIRASMLQRLLSTVDPAVGDVYRTSFADGRSPRSLAPPDDRDPPFLAAFGVTPEQIAATREAARGKRLLLVHRRFYEATGPCQTEAVACLAITAARFGLSVQEFRFTGGNPATALAPALLQTILDSRPDVIFYDNRYPWGASHEPEALAAQIAAVFALVRAQLGVRVVLGYMDAWEQALVGPHELYRGLGSAFDLVQYSHAAALGTGTPEQTERTFCHILPTLVPAPTVAPGTIPRACFAGSMSWFNDSRVAWWAETARRGLPLDFFETLHVGGVPRSDQDYANLFAAHQVSVNFTRRYRGPTICTGRTIDVPVAGGVLLEEDSIDSAYFLKPGVHYLPFTTLDDLGAHIEALLGDPARRERMRAAARRWVQTYFTGDHFWAGLLRKLAALA